jgi:nucleotide-binding universal stress UspA family protein
MTSKPPIVVGVDGSPSAEQATRWAAREASLTRTPLHLVHAYAWAELSRFPGALKPAMRNQDLFLAEAREYLDRAVSAARAAAPDVVATTEFVTEHPIDVLTARSRSADRIVLGSRGLGGVSGLLLGSVAVGVTAHAACPVVVVRGDGTAPGSDAPVVVGIDTSEHSEAVLRFGYDHAALHGAPLHVLTTWSDSVVEPSTAMFLDVAAIAEEERCRLSERVAGWREKYPDVVVHTEVHEDRPAHALVAASEGARLIVVGARGRGGVAGLLLGSTSQALIHRAGCPVAVVRG